MAITLNKLAYDLLEMIRGTIVDDESIDLRQIKFWINNHRAMWIRRELGKSTHLDTAYVQSLGAQAVTDVDSSIEEAALLSGCIIKVTGTLPKFIELPYGPAITYVGPLDLLDSGGYKRQHPNTMNFIGHGKFNRLETCYTYMNGKVYVLFNSINLDAKLIKKIRIDGIFENPEDLKELSDASGNPLYTDDSPYPISNWMIGYMKAGIVKDDLILRTRAVSDKLNDADDNLTTP